VACAAGAGAVDGAWAEYMDDPARHGKIRAHASILGDVDVRRLLQTSRYRARRLVTASRSVAVQRSCDAVAVRARAQQTVRRQRQDFHQKAARALGREYATNATNAYEDVQTPHPAQEPPPRRVDAGHRVGRLPGPPRLPGSLRREAGPRRGACVHQPSRFRVRHDGRPRRVPPPSRRARTAA